MERTDSQMLLKRAGSTLVRILKSANKAGDDGDVVVEPRKSNEGYYASQLPATCNVFPHLSALDGAKTVVNSPCSPLRGIQEVRSLVPGAAAANNMPSTSDGSASKDVVLEVVKHINKVQPCGLRSNLSLSCHPQQAERLLLSMCGFDGNPDKLKRVLQGNYDGQADKLSVMLEEAPHTDGEVPPSTPR